MRNLSVGTKVRIVHPGANVLPDEECLLGAIGHITKIGFWNGVARFHLDLPPHLGFEIAPIREALLPLYDGDEPASWETCAWRPREITHAQR